MGVGGEPAEQGAQEPSGPPARPKRRLRSWLEFLGLLAAVYCGLFCIIAGGIIAGGILAVMSRVILGVQALMPHLWRRILPAGYGLANRAFPVAQDHGTFSDRIWWAIASAFCFDTGISILAAA